MVKKIKILHSAMFFVYCFVNIDKDFIKELYGIKSRTAFLHKVMIKKKNRLNPRCCINWLFMNDNRSKIEEKVYGLKSYFIEMNKRIHPFINYDYVKANHQISDWRYAFKIEKILLTSGEFQDQRFFRTDIALNYETPPLGILEAIHLAGNAYMYDGRLLYPLRKK